MTLKAPQGGNQLRRTMDVIWDEFLADNAVRATQTPHGGTRDVGLDPHTRTLNEIRSILHRVAPFLPFLFLGIHDLQTRKRAVEEADRNLRHFLSLADRAGQDFPTLRPDQKARRLQDLGGQFERLFLKSGDTQMITEYEADSNLLKLLNAVHCKLARPDYPVDP